MVKLIPVAALCLLAQGCVGFLIGRAKTETVKNPSIQDKPHIYGVHASNRPSDRTAAWLQEHWGKPASVRPVSTEPGTERWTYKFGPVWYGVIPIVIVPVPVAVPVTRKKVVFFVREGQVVSAVRVKQHMTGVAAGAIGPDAYSWSYAEW